MLRKKQEKNKTTEASGPESLEAIASRLEDVERRLLVVGMTGHGKSSTANTILGYSRFEENGSSNSVTAKPEFETKWYKEKSLVLVDTPGFIDTGKTTKEVRGNIRRVFGFMSPGMHAVLFIFKCGTRATPEVLKAIQIYKDIFKSDVDHYTFVVITNWTRHFERKNGNPQRYLQHNFNKLFTLCEGKILTVNNHADDPTDNIEFVQNLMFRIEDNLSYLRGACFSNLTFKLIEFYFNNFSRPWKVSLRIKCQWLRRIAEALKEPYTQDEESGKASSTPDAEEVYDERTMLQDRNKIRKELLENEGYLPVDFFLYAKEYLNLDDIVGSIVNQG